MDLEVDHSLQLQLAGAAFIQSSTITGCVSDFFEVVVPSYSEAAFRSHFRMSRNTMEVRKLSSINTITINKVILF